ncbi:MAG: hypothetical protein GXP11_05375 [Gammaproteobacteria bacterium]|nr:hypothetical protein [Gammaproteobacteria bacterium]
MRVPSCAFIVCLSLALGGRPASGAEWQIDPTLRFNAGYNDNIRLNTSNKTATAVATFSPSTVFSVATPTSGASGALRFDFRRFEADSDLNDNNARLTTNLYHNLEQSKLDLNLSFVNDTTLDSQLDATGVAFSRITRQSLNVSPQWTYAFNARTNVSANYSYNSTKYKNSGNTVFVNFTINSGSISLKHILDERLEGSITLSGVQSNNDNKTESTNINLQGGASYKLSDTWSSSLFVGVRRTNTRFTQNSSTPIFSPVDNTLIGFFPLTQDVSNSNQGLTFSAALNKTLQRGGITLTATRSIRNNFNGQPIETTSLRPTIRYQFNETLSGQLNMRFTTTKADTNLTSSLNQTSYQIKPAITWNITNFWRLYGNYLYRKQTFDSTHKDATQNVVSLTLIYLWPKISVSR